MNKNEIRKMAYREAAGWLARDADSNDLDEGLSGEEEDEIRVFIRDVIVPYLEKKGT